MLASQVLGIFKQLTKTDPQCEFDCAQTLVVIAEVARRSGAAMHAKGQLGSALRTYKNAIGDNHPDVAHVHNSMGGLLFEIGTPDAMQEAREHVPMARSCGGAWPKPAPTMRRTRDMSRN